MSKCKRCGKELRSQESIKRGYGKTCYRIVQLQEVKESEVKPKINQEIAFLKMEIKMLKRMMKQIKTNGVKVESIERIKPEESRPERTENKNNMSGVITEMKEIFNENFNFRDYLKPINPIEIPIIHPIMVEVLA